MLWIIKSTIRSSPMIKKDIKILNLFRFCHDRLESILFNTYSNHHHVHVASSVYFSGWRFLTELKFRSWNFALFGKFSQDTYTCPFREAAVHSKLDRRIKMNIIPIALFGGIVSFILWEISFFDCKSKSI